MIDSKPDIHNRNPSKNYIFIKPLVVVKFHYEFPLKHSTHIWMRSVIALVTVLNSLVWTTIEKLAFVHNTGYQREISPTNHKILKIENMTILYFFYFLKMSKLSDPSRVCYWNYKAQINRSLILIRRYLRQDQLHSSRRNFFRKKNLSNTITAVQMFHARQHSEESRNSPGSAEKEMASAHSWRTYA